MEPIIPDPFPYDQTVVAIIGIGYYKIGKASRSMIVLDAFFFVKIKRGNPR
jgi:hypothetical protein